MIVLYFILFCIAFIVAIRLANWVLGQLIKFLHDRKRNGSPFYKIKNKLEDDLSQANFSNDWRKIQEINLKLLWLETYFKVQSKVLSNQRQESDETFLITKFTEENLKFPVRWKLDDFYCYAFSQEILAAYRRVLVENAYKGMYKPDKILPVPKGYIFKAIRFTFDYMKQTNPINPVPDNEKLAENLSSIESLLNITFIDTGDDDLPTESVENMKASRLYRDRAREQDNSSKHDLSDWKH